jgi:vacuolar protein sorting-associated protein 3
LLTRVIKVDTVLAKLYSEFGRTSELFSLLQEPNSILLSEVEPLLLRKGQYSALCMLYKERGEDLKLLEAWSKYVIFIILVVPALNIR